MLPWLATLLPAELGLATALCLQDSSADNAVIYVRGQVSVWLSWLGLAFTFLAMIGLAAWSLVQRRMTQTQSQTLSQAAADRRRFLQRLDHELKNPLTAIRAGLANVADNPSPDAFESVDEQVRRLSRLTADLRKLSELETRPLEHSSVNLSKLLTQVFELAQDRPEAGERRMTLSLPQAPWPCRPSPAIRTCSCWWPTICLTMPSSLRAPVTLSRCVRSRTAR